MRIASSRKPGLAAAGLKPVNTSRGGLVQGTGMSTNTHGGTRSARLIIAALCLLGGCAGAHAADAPLVLEHLTTSDVLRQGTVFATLQDAQGFVWLATEDGLVRYDGHELFRYAYSRSARGGLPGNYVQAMVEDRHHDLWIALKDGGVARWQRATDTFIVYRHDPDNPASLANDDVRALLEDQAGHLWVGTAGGLDMLNRATGQFSHYRHEPSDPDSLRDSFIMSLYQDEAGLVWIGTRAGGVSRWNPRSWELGGHRPAWLGDKLVTAFADASDNKVWIDSLGGGLTR